MDVVAHDTGIIFKILKYLENKIIMKGYFRKGKMELR